MLPNQGLDLTLHWKASPQPLDHQGTFAPCSLWLHLSTHVGQEGAGSVDHSPILQQNTMQAEEGETHI